MTVGVFEHIFFQVAGNLKSQILKSSNSRRLPGGMLKFRIDRYIMCLSINVNQLVADAAAAPSNV